MAIIDDIRVNHDPAKPVEPDPGTYEIITQPRPPIDLTAAIEELNRLGYIVQTREEWQMSIVRRIANVSGVSGETPCKNFP